MDTETTTPELDAALAPTTFDVLSFVEQTAYPEKMVTIFRDVGAAKEYKDAVAERAELERTAEYIENSPEIAALTARLEDLADQLKKSSMTFQLRGYAPGIVEDIQKQHEAEGETGADMDLIARAIVKVLDADGNADTHLWTPDDVAKLKRFLAEGEFVKLLVGVAEVIFNAAVFEQATDAGFPG